MLTWLNLLGRCLLMSMFALAHELPLSPLQIHENLVLNPAFCYMRVPGSLSPFLTKTCSCHSWAGFQAGLPGAQAGEGKCGYSSSTGRKAWHGTHQSPLLHTDSPASQAVSRVASFPATCFPRWIPYSWNYLTLWSPQLLPNLSFQLSGWDIQKNKSMTCYSSLAVISKHPPNAICKISGTQL